MAANDLNTPLHDKRRRSRKSRGLPWARMLSVTAFALALTAFVWIAIVDDPEGGRPVEYAQIEGGEPQTTGSVSTGSQTTRSPSSQSGAAAGLPVDVAALPRARAPKSVRATAAPIEGLVEKSEFGPLPVIGADGLRPLDAYARPANAGPADGFPRVVLIVVPGAAAQHPRVRPREAPPA
jgi:hypothetical protein